MTANETVDSLPRAPTITSTKHHIFTRKDHLIHFLVVDFQIWPGSISDEMITHGRFTIESLKAGSVNVGDAMTIPGE